MNGETYVFRDGKVIPKHLAPPLHPRHGSGPMIISDFTEPVKSLVDGHRYSSKRQYRDHLRAHGCVEVGNDFNAMPQKNAPSGVDTNVAPAIAQAVEQVKSGAHRNHDPVWEIPE